MEHDLRELESVVGKLLRNHPRITILEAGCGSMSRIQFHQEARLVGIDISQKQLDRNTNLNEKILGDLETYPLPASAYDMIICWDVLEHLANPEKALENFAKAVSENGIIVLASPNVMTLRGFATKFTPHWFHILFYKYVYGIKDAGKDDNCPFKSYHRFSIAPNALLKFAARHGLVAEFWKTYDFEHYEKSNVALRSAWNFVNRIASILSLNAVQTDEHKSFMMVLRKRQQSTSPREVPAIDEFSTSDQSARRTV